MDEKNQKQLVFIHLREYWTILMMVNPMFIFANPILYAILMVVGGILLDIGVLLVAIGAMKLGGLFKDMLSKVAGIIGLIAAILALVATILAVVVVFAPAILVVVGIMGIVGGILLGVFFILLGIAFIILRVKIGMTGLAMAAGIMAIIAGSVYCSVILSFIGAAILIPVAILAAMLFLKTKGIPEEEVKEVRKLAVRPAEVKVKVRLKPEEIESGVYAYVRKHPEGIDVAECAESLGVSEADVEKAINALVKKGKLETG